MSDNSRIEWTEATWNPTTGCTKVSPGCDHCYAEGIYNRFHGPGAFDTVTLRPERLDQPLRWRKPRKVFVNSMSDLFHEDVPDDYIARVFAVMALAPQHSFQVLTKRHGRMRSLLNNGSWRMSVCVEMERLQPYCLDVLSLDEPLLPLRNVWLGVSVEDQKWADIRIPALLDTPAAVRFLSCEPLLGLVGIADILYDGGIHWVIVGGESGLNARPMEPWWARELRDECVQAGVPFFFKQWGGRTAKAGGRLLDGRTWDEYPREVVPA